MVESCLLFCGERPVVSSFLLLLIGDDASANNAAAVAAVIMNWPIAIRRRSSSDDSADMINREQVVFVICDDADCNGEMLLRTSGARRRPKERRNVFETARRPKKTMNGTFNFMIFKEERRRGLKNVYRS